MNPGAGVAPIIAAAIHRADRKLIEALRERNATSAANATSLTPDHHLQRVRLARLTREGVIHAVADGRVYLDEQALAEYQRLRHKRIWLVFAAIAVVVVIAIIVARWV